MSCPAQRLRPNILISGTPGTGKSTLCDSIVSRLGMTCVNVGKLVGQKGYHAGKDAEFDALIIDETSEEQLLDEMEPVLSAGNICVEHIAVDFFPERWFDLVLVLRTDNSILYDRLKARGYSDKKLEENISAEIMQVVLEEARENYKPDVVHEIPSNSVEDCEANVERVESWYRQWIRDHPTGVPA